MRNCLDSPEVRVDVHLLDAVVVVRLLREHPVGRVEQLLAEIV